MDAILSLTPNIDYLPYLFGFSVYALFTIWIRLAARWINWFPLAAKLTRLSLYGAAIVVAILGMSLLGTLNASSAIGIIAGFATAPVLNKFLRVFKPRERVRRGARISNVADVNRQVSKLPSSETKNSFKIGGITIPRGAEPYHFLLVGATGSGKSVAITQLIDHLEARGDMALIVDSGGEFASRYYQEGRDHILNPFDDRCAPWSPTAEIEGTWDTESLAKSMIPDGTGESKEWNGYAQTLVTSVLRQLVERKDLSIRKLLYYIQAAPISELEPLLAGTPAAAQLTSDKTFGSIRTIASNYLATYAYLQDDNNPFSVAKFIRKGNPGFLFLTYRDDQLDSLNSMIACVLDIAARTILALPSDRARRIWLIVDECASIGKVQSIEAVATKARKAGGCLLLGLQNISQLKDRYGEHGAQTILSCLSSWLVLRSSDADTAEYISKYIGEAEISRMTRGESSSAQGGSDSLSEQIQMQRAVMPAEIQRLANLEGFFKLAGAYPVAAVKLNFPAKRSDATTPFEARDFNEKPMLNLSPPQEAQSPAPTPSPNSSNPSQEGNEPREREIVVAEEDSWEALGLAENQPKQKITPLTKTSLDMGPEELEGVLNALALASGEPEEIIFGEGAEDFSPGLGSSF